jgi:hypothetical protein
VTFTLDDIKRMGRACAYCEGWYIPTGRSPRQQYCTPKCGRAASRDRQALRESEQAGRVMHSARVIQEWRAA